MQIFGVSLFSGHDVIESRLFFFNDTATTEIYTLSLHDALPICEFLYQDFLYDDHGAAELPDPTDPKGGGNLFSKPDGDRKSTRLNSSHSQISYAVFCLKKKKNIAYAACSIQRPENRDRRVA